MSLSKRISKKLAAYLFAGVAAWAIFWFICARNQLDTHVPFWYAGDTLYGCEMIREMIRGEWFPFFGIRSRYIGVPFGMSMGDFPVSEQLHFLFMKVLSLFSHDPFQVYNWYYLLGFPLAAMTFVFTVRRLRVGYPTAIACGLLFALMPFHLMRYHHFSYAAYYTLPLQVFVLLGLWSKRALFAGPGLTRKDWLSGAIALASGVTNTYYAFFFCFLALVSGAGAALYRKNARHMFSAIAIVSLVCASGAVALAPNIYHRIKHGPNPAVAHRDRSEAEALSLKLNNVFTPRSNDRIALFREIKSAYHSGTGPTEGEDESFGLIVTLATLSLIVLALTSRSMKHPLHRVANLVVAALLLGLMGGLGTVFAFYVSPLIRCYDRISILIACLSLTGLALLLSELGRRKGRHIECVAAALLLCFGIFEQATSEIRKTQLAGLDEFRSDRAFVQQIESASPHGSILQLPYSDFPESPPHEKMGDYSHFKGPLLSQDLRWSYGSMKGREAAKIVESLSRTPLDLEAIRKAGYAGIYIDRFGFADSGRSIEADLSQRLSSPPLVSSNGRLAYFVIH